MPRPATQAPPATPAANLLPPNREIGALAAAAADCKACELWTKGTQTVFGRGPGRAELMLVGEQPGDAEDIQGSPFVGPAGTLLDKALERAGIARARTYVTNAVKHFNWDETRGKRRIHKKPNARHIAACKPWLDAEIEAAQPRVIVALGATASQALCGRDFKITKHRGEVTRSGPAPYFMATVHPSSILRARTDDERRIAFEAFVDDLRRIAPLIEGS